MKISCSFWKAIISFYEIPALSNCDSFFRLENGWFVREVPSPVQTGGTSSTVPSTPPSDGEHEILVLNGDISEMRTKDHRNPESNKQTKKVGVYVESDSIFSGNQMSEN